jgi:hypothetical protein
MGMTARKARLTGPGKRKGAGAGESVKAPAAEDVAKRVSIAMQGGTRGRKLSFSRRLARPEA